jgi:hypothetical protein
MVPDRYMTKRQLIVLFNMWTGAIADGLLKDGDSSTPATIRWMLKAHGARWAKERGVTVKVFSFDPFRCKTHKVRGVYRALTKASVRFIRTLTQREHKIRRERVHAAEAAAASRVSSMVLEY